VSHSLKSIIRITITSEAYSLNVPCPQFLCKRSGEVAACTSDECSELDSELSQTHGIDEALAELGVFYRARAVQFLIARSSLQSATEEVRPDGLLSWAWQLLRDLTEREMNDGKLLQTCPTCLKQQLTCFCVLRSPERFKGR
jgi:hypothetical protein